MGTSKNPDKKPPFSKRIRKRTDRILIMVIFAHKGTFSSHFSAFSWCIPNNGRT